MEKLKVSIYNELLILQKYRLTAEEWFVTQLLFLGSSDERDPVDYLKIFYSGGIATVSLHDMLVALQSKGILTQEYRIPKLGQIFDPESIIFNKSFLKSHFAFSDELGEDLYNHYPIYYKQYQLNNITKIYPDMTYFGRAYGKAIKWNSETHKKVIELLEWGKESNLICYGINEFIGSHKWNELEKLKNEGFSGELDIMEVL